MNKIFLALLLTFGLSYQILANNTSQNMTTGKIKKMDRSLSKHKTVKRNFTTQKEFNRSQKKMRHSKHGAAKKKYGNSYNNGYNYGNNERDYRRPIRQRAYAHTTRGWVLAYQYDRASFYDRDGYFYGYFNRHGYYFEDVFYRYDRYYSYQDRIRGRGLFDRRYYMPQNASHYGFCQTRHNEPNYPRGYDRY